MLTLNEVFAQAGQEEVALIKDEQIFYLVLNREDNVFNYEFMTKIHQCLDEIEKSQGPACLVTIGTGKKLFSTGFDLELWKKSLNDQYQSILRMQEVLSRFLTLEIPTMCVFNGSAIAGGLLLGLTHDFRILREEKAYICLSELNFGGTLTPGLASLLRNSVTPKVAKQLMFGGRFKSLQALKMDVVDNLFKDQEDLESQIRAFEKEYAPKAEYRISLKDYKTNLNIQAHKDLMFEGMTRREMIARFNLGVKL
eukprot:403349446